MKTFEIRNGEELRLFFDEATFTRGVEKLKHRRNRLEAKKRADQRKARITQMAGDRSHGL